MITVNEAIDTLNRALEKDPDAMNALFSYYVPCNTELAKDPTIQVAVNQKIVCAHGVMGQAEPLTLGILGLINGLFGVDNDMYGYITAVFDDDNKLVRFEKTRKE